MYKAGVVYVRENITNCKQYGIRQKKTPQRTNNEVRHFVYIREEHHQYTRSYEAI